MGNLNGEIFAEYPAANVVVSGEYIRLLCTFDSAESASGAINDLTATRDGSAVDLQLSGIYINLPAVDAGAYVFSYKGTEVWRFVYSGV